MSLKKKGLFYKSIFIVGLLSILWEIRIYRRTIIEIKILIGIILFVGIVSAFFSVSDFQKLFGYKRKITLYFWTMIQCTASWGFLACSLFMFTNYYLSSNDSERLTFKIMERSSVLGRKRHRDERKPTFEIMYKGKSKEIVFPHEYYNNMESYKVVELVVKDGFLGFDILVEQRLK